MGKFSKVLGQLEKAPVQDQSYQDKVEKEKEKLKDGVTHTPESLAKLYATARHKLEDLEILRYQIQITATALEQMLVESNEGDEPGWGLYGAGPDTVKLASGACVDVLWEPDVKVEDKEAYRRWCATPTDKCVECGGGPKDPQHWVDPETTPVSQIPEGHRFRPGAGLEKSLQMWPSTTIAIGKERLLAGQPQPDGVKVYSRAKVKFRKA